MNLNSMLNRVREEGRSNMWDMEGYVADKYCARDEIRDLKERVQQLEYAVEILSNIVAKNMQYEIDIKSIKVGGKRWHDIDCYYK